jgi:hypothetical protein
MFHTATIITPLTTHVSYSATVELWVQETHKQADKYVTCVMPSIVSPTPIPIPYSPPFLHSFSSSTPGFTNSNSLVGAASDLLELVPSSLKRVHTINKKAGRAISLRRNNKKVGVVEPVPALPSSILRVKTITKFVGQSITKRRNERKVRKENVLVV